MTRRDSRGRFAPGTSGNPRGRPPESERIRVLLEPHREELVERAVALALAGDVTALRLCLERLAPPPRAEARPVRIAGLEAAQGLTERADVLLRAVAQGELAPDVGERLLSALSHVARAIELDDLARRVAALEGGET